MQRTRRGAATPRGFFTARQPCFSERKSELQELWPQTQDHSKWNARSRPPWALAQAPSLTHWGHRTPRLASVTLHFFVCVLRDNDTTLLGSVHPVFLGCRLCALLCARSGICLGQGDTSLCSKGLSALTGEGLSPDLLQGDSGGID